MSMNWAEQRTSHWFVTGWADAFAALLGSGEEGKTLPLTLQPGDPHLDAWKAWKDPVWYTVPAHSSEGAELLVGCALDTAKALAANSGEIQDSVPRAFRNLIDQTLDALTPTIEVKTGRRLSFEPAGEGAPPKDGSLGVEYQIHVGGTVHLLALVPSSEFVDDVLSRTADPAGAERWASEVPVSDNLKVLMDVDLDLAVSFGKTQMLLEEVLKLASGSIVELNRSANDPVDVLVNNSVVARGEVVVVDGNYGIRVTEVVSQKERIRSVM